MELLASAFFFVFGAILIFASLVSAFRTVVLPRAAFDPLTRGIFLGLRSFLLWTSGHSSRYLGRETALSLHAPLGLLALALSWAVGIILGFTLLFEATGSIGLGRALVLAGSSFTTLGFTAPASGIHEALAIIAAILGLAVVALLIAYLPTIYGLFSQREVHVADVAIKSGGTAHGPDLVRNLTRGADTVRLDEMWMYWEHWLITLGETHTSEPSLNFFRSPRPGRSWLTAATAVLDAAVLRNTVIEAPFSARADMTYRAGAEALEGIGHFFFVRPDGTDVVGTRIRREDFDAELALMESDDIPIVDDRDGAWEAFVSLRSTYEAQVLGLSELILPPPARWSSSLIDAPEPEGSAEP